MDNQGKQDTETETQDGTVPTPEQKTAEQPNEVQSPQKELESDLPDSVSDRTRREFEKLRSDLRDEKARREYYESIFTTLQTPKETQDQGEYYDPALKAAQEAKERVSRAEGAIQEFLKDQEERDVYKDYPQLDPQERFGTKHDKSLHVETRRIMLDSMVNPDDYGGQLDFKKAAGLAFKNLSNKKSMDKAKEEGAKQALEGLESKEQASADVISSQGSQKAKAQESMADLETLRHATRQGDENALAQRIKRWRENNS